MQVLHWYNQIPQAYHTTPTAGNHNTHCYTEVETANLTHGTLIVPWNEWFILSPHPQLFAICRIAEQANTEGLNSHVWALKPIEICKARWTRKPFYINSSPGTAILRQTCEIWQRRLWWSSFQFAPSKIVRRKSTSRLNFNLAQNLMLRDNIIHANSFPCHLLIRTFFALLPGWFSLYNLIRSLFSQVDL